MKILSSLIPELCPDPELRTRFKLFAESNSVNPVLQTMDSVPVEVISHHLSVSKFAADQGARSTHQCLVFFLLKRN